MIFLLWFFSIFNLLYKPKYTRFPPRGGSLFSAAMLFCISLKKKGFEFQIVWLKIVLAWVVTGGRGSSKSGPVLAPRQSWSKSPSRDAIASQGKATIAPPLRLKLGRLELMPRATNFAWFNFHKLIIFKFSSIFIFWLYLAAKVLRAAIPRISWNSRCAWLLVDRIPDLCTFYELQFMIYCALFISTLLASFPTHEFQIIVTSFGKLTYLGKVTNLLST